MNAAVEKKNAILREIFMLEDELEQTFNEDTFLEIMKRLAELDTEIQEINRQMRENPHHGNCQNN